MQNKLKRRDDQLKTIVKNNNNKSKNKNYTFIKIVNVCKHHIFVIMLIVSIKTTMIPMDDKEKFRQQFSYICLK